MDFMQIHGTASVPPGKDDASSTPNSHGDLEAEIRRRVQWLSNDCSTFWRVRLEQTEWYNKNTSTDSQPSGLGGGNFVMALAMLSACNFLAKAHSFLVKPEAFVTEDDREKVKSAKATIKNEIPEMKPLFKSSKTNWIPPKSGSCNETEAFERLIEALHGDGIDLGLATEQARDVWERFRNKLAHMAHPEGIVEVSTANESKPLEDAKGAIERSVLPFRMKDGRWVCNADRLSLDLVAVAEWLCKKIDECAEEDRITRLADWMFEDTDFVQLNEPDVQSD